MSSRGGDKSIYNTVVGLIDCSVIIKLLYRFHVKRDDKKKSDDRYEPRFFFRDIRRYNIKKRKKRFVYI